MAVGFAPEDVAGPLPGSADPAQNTPAVQPTTLSPGDEKKFQAWQSALPPRLQESNDYDLRGFWKANPGFQLDKEGQHLTDEFKLPNHDTFSNESRYYNPDTAPYGGKWQEHPDHSWSFIPNDPTKKRRIDEDANGNRAAPAVPPPGGALGDQLATPEGAASPTTMEPAAPVVPERPKRPDLTGDLQQDLKNNLLYTRSLEDWHDAQQAANTAKANDLNTDAAKRQLEEDQRQQKERDALREQQKQERAARQADIDAAVREKVQAQQAKPQSSTMGRIGSAFAILAGGLGAGLSAAGGHPTANLALEQFNKQQDREYEQLKQRRLEANDAVLQARYGFKDAVDNQRAALNDLDADFSARHKILADQAAYELKRAGLSPEQIQANELVAGNLQKSAAYEEQVHEREQKAQDERTHYRAEESLANANMKIAMGHLGLDRDKMNLAHEDRQDAIAERAAAAAERADKQKQAAADKKEERAYRDPDTGEIKGYAPTARQVTGLADKVNAQRAYVDAVKALRDDVEQKGHIYNPLSEDAKVRQQLYSDAVARGRKARDLGVSGANLALEHKAFAGDGTGINRTPSTKVLDQMIDDQHKITQGLLRSTLTPADADRRVDAPFSGSSGPPKPVIDQAYKALDDPKAPREVKAQAAKVLQEAGVL